MQAILHFWRAMSVIIMTRNLWNESVIGRWNGSVFSLMDNTSLSFYLMACKIGFNPAKVNDLEIALWAFKNAQNVFGSTIKTFQLKYQHKTSCKSEFPFCCCCYCCWHHLHRIFSVSISFSFIKIFENLWKWFEFIYDSFLVSSTCFNFAFICTSYCH